MSHPYNTDNKQVACRGVACCPFLEFAEDSSQPLARAAQTQLTPYLPGTCVHHFLADGSGARCVTPGSQ